MQAIEWFLAEFPYERKAISSTQRADILPRTSLIPRLPPPTHSHEFLYMKFKFKHLMPKLNFCITITHIKQGGGGEATLELEHLVISAQKS